ncbi:TIGR02453 family protein [Putridiphycobacter roseus]|uniref:TIGR02453 family protein n=1 Tax=Putridiphycobacter roseus TaxID=2219161 RepID=A0A2W1NBQ4_9FLAO|nr:DUF2461 domain-containing protein [Putridiphycobacter roseus]PZE16755.1 TIGR02453 family protein [Putridiphycobacter roseus]
MAQIQKSIFKYINDLKKNNNREWFAENKDRYEFEKEHFILFADDLLNEVKQHDHLENLNGKKSIFRIYRDVRFSKNKAPYKAHFSGSFKRATKQLRGGYYFHIEPNNSFVGGGFWGPESKDLKKMRYNIAEFEDEFRAILNNKALKKQFGELQGDQLKTAPKGIDKAHPAIDLLRYKQYILTRSFTDEEVLSPNFMQEVNSAFKAMRPFLDFMSEALTTDENGEVIV